MSKCQSQHCHPSNKSLFSPEKNQWFHDVEVASLRVVWKEHRFQAEAEKAASHEKEIHAKYNAKVTGDMIRVGTFFAMSKEEEEIE